MAGTSPAMTTENVCVVERSAAMPQPIAAEIGAGRRIIGPRVQAARMIRRRADHHLRWIGIRRAFGIAGEGACDAEPGCGRGGGEIAGEKAVGRIVAMVVAVVIGPW